MRNLIVTLLIIWATTAQAHLSHLQDQTVKIVDSSGIGRANAVVLEEDFAITAYHIMEWSLENKELLSLIWRDGTERRILVYKQIDNLDLARVWFKPVRKAFKANIRCSEVEVNESVGVITNMWSMNWALVRGWVTLHEQDTILLQMPLYIGSSGSGVFDSIGRLVGIIVGIPTGPVFNWLGHPIIVPRVSIGFASAVPATHLC